MGPADDLLDPAPHLQGHSEFRQVKLYRRPVQHAQDNALAKLGGHGCDTEVDRAGAK